MYVKLFASLYQGTLRGKSHAILVFTNLLAHASQDGEVDVHPRAISEETGLSIDEVRAALLFLEAPDEESRTPDFEGRRIVRLSGHRDWGWEVVNYTKYREIRSEADRKTQNREAQARWRERQRALRDADVIRNADSKRNADSNENKPASATVSRDKPKQKQKQKRDIGCASPVFTGLQAVESPKIPEGFASFWSTWPAGDRKADKKKCLDKWKRHDFEAISEKIVSHVESQKSSRKWQDGYDPAPLTYLNGQRWDDEDEVPTTNGRSALFAGAI